MDVHDEATGAFIKFVQNWPQETSEDLAHDFALLSCRWFGHTFEHNPGESRCDVCGASKQVESHAEVSRE